MSTTAPAIGQTTPTAPTAAVTDSAHSPHSTTAEPAATSQNPAPAADSPAPQPRPRIRPGTRLVSGATRAVACCLKAYQEAYSAKAAKGKVAFDCHQAGREAFLQCLPGTDTINGVNAFVTCVVQAIKMEIIYEPKARELLYAAQVAMSVHNRRRRRK